MTNLYFFMDKKFFDSLNSLVFATCSFLDIKIHFFKDYFDEEFSLKKKQMLNFKSYILTHILIIFKFFEKFIWKIAVVPDHLIFNVYYFILSFNVLDFFQFFNGLCSNWLLCCGFLWIRFFLSSSTCWSSCHILMSSTFLFWDENSCDFISIKSKNALTCMDGI